MRATASHERDQTTLCSDPPSLASELSKESMTVLKFDGFVLKVMCLAMHKNSTSRSSCNRNEFETSRRPSAEIPSPNRLSSLYMSIVICTSFAAIK